MLLAPIVQLVRAYDSVEWAIFISEWQKGLQGYYAVKRIGGSGNLGRNVIGLCRPSTTVAFLIQSSEVLPGDREGMDERCIDRGDAGALGGIAAGGEGAHVPVVPAGPGGGVGRSVS